MPFYLTYEFHIPYRVFPFLGAQPALDVRLTFGTRKMQTLGILDSGSMLTVFDEEIASRLGIEDITKGRAARGISLGGPVEIYQFDMEMSVIVNGRFVRFPAQIGFCPGYRRRNILGRNLVFAHFQVGIREREQGIYLQPES